MEKGGEGGVGEEGEGVGRGLGGAPAGIPVEADRVAPSDAAGEREGGGEGREGCRRGGGLGWRWGWGRGEGGWGRKGRGRGVGRGEVHRHAYLSRTAHTHTHTHTHIEGGLGKFFRFLVQMALPVLLTQSMRNLRRRGGRKTVQRRGRSLCDVLIVTFSL